MEEWIATLSKSLGMFCNNLQSSCDALKLSVDRRPIPLDSASSTFLQCLNSRVSDASTDLNLLESMAFDTVSFEELLGHCNELFKKNHSDLLLLQDRLKSSGYVPQIDIEDDGEEGNYEPSTLSNDRIDTPPSTFSSSLMNRLEEDPLTDESLSLKSLGLSDACLATLASSEANGNIDDSHVSLREPMMCSDNINSSCQTGAKATEGIEGQCDGNLKPAAIVEVSKDDYESLPSYMKNLTSWEDLLDAVEKINSGLGKKEQTKGSNYFLQDEIESLDLGHKARTYLLLLVRMNHLVVETIDGLISYKVLQKSK